MKPSIFVAECNQGVKLTNFVSINYMYLSGLVLWSIQFSCVTSQTLVVNDPTTFVCTLFLSRQVHYKDLLNHQLLRVKNNLKNIKLESCSKYYSKIIKFN